MKKFRAVIMAFGICILGLCCSMVTAKAKDADGNIVIVIDAGHGGEDSGKIATETKTYESHINLTIAMAMRDELMQYEGVKVYLTRSDDIWLSNTGRSMVAAAMHADFLISLHNNSSESAASNGALVIRTVNQYYAEQTSEMAALILDNLGALGLAKGNIITRLDERYANEDYYTLIGEGVRAGVPSIIVEHCFLSNHEDQLFVSNADGSVNVENCRKMGLADANAVISYFKLTKRTAKAESDSKVLKLPKGYSVKVVTPTADSNVTWYSIDSTIATVTSDGVATAVGTGTTNIYYKLVTGETGYLTLEVEKTAPLALVGCMKVTFYDDTTPEKTFQNMKKDSLFGVVIYNDGTSKKVSPTMSSNVDFSQIGIQDIPIAYEGLTGFLRVCHNTSAYVPEVTEAPSEEDTKPVEETTVALEETETETDPASFMDTEITLKVAMKWLIFAGAVLLLIVIGLMIALIERNRRKHRRRRRRYY